MGDTYAYKIQNSKYKDRYLIIRKIDNCEYESSIRYQSAIVYIQITSNKELPRNEKEINKLEYIIISLVDSLMIGGFVKNPVGTITEDVKQETYKRIDELRDRINSSTGNEKEKRIEILNDFEKTYYESMQFFYIHSFLNYELCQNFYSHIILKY